MTTQDEIERVHANGTHIVLLGAGATLASTIYRPEKNGKSLPLMWNIVDVIGLKDIVATLPSNLQNLANDFEKLYSTLYGMAEYVHQREEIEKEFISILVS
ncbi:MAG: hypothetical protein M0D57_08255 [Sphingobacteriales bacterium JAD_PAG50586_3]|nr:MAG: hypothetical protein M0D57_08255 [Sphingobacteriales bacterium JAD_PAG50586_3]